MPNPIQTKRWVFAVLLLLVSSASLIYGVYQIWLRNLPVNLNAGVLAADSILIKNYPVKMAIPSLALELPVTPSKITNGKWQDPKNTVGYLQDSVLPGQKGNSIFYGHNFPNIFGTLDNIKSGDKVVVTFLDSTIMEFTVADTFTVTADQTHILKETVDERLTIYTCTGFLDSKRFVVIAH
ncbi:sortase [Patescibacteria group bacterium]|nr:sortase [Patescibacteria group bacterium]